MARYNPKDEIVLKMSVREYAELVEALRVAEVNAAGARAHELDFRMQRIRLERKFRDSKPPEVEDSGTGDTQFMSLEQIAEMTRKPRG